MSPEFEYQAKNRNGDKIKGVLEAEESSIVARQLRERGYYLTSIKEKGQKKDLNDYFSFAKKKVKINDLAIFSQQFAAMINAGVNLVDTLNILYDQIDHPRLKEVVRSIQENVETGSGLSESMQQYPDVFPDLYCQMIKAGETGGVLDKVLNELAVHYEKQDEINGKIKSALYYPVTILFVAIVVVTFLVLKVVPNFVGIFEGLGGNLPLPTRILLGMSELLQSYWWIIFLFTAIIIFFLLNYINSPRGEMQFDALKLKVPVIGEMFKKVYVSRFSSTLSILLDSGVDLLSALTIVENVIGNKVYAKILTEARTEVREGVSFSEPLSRHDEFPRMVVQMIKVGEESGSISQMLNKISDFYDREVETGIEGSISLIEPVMIVLLAIVVGFIVISIVMPMFDMFTYY